MPPAPDLDVVAVGNAIVDVLSETTDQFLVEHGLQKGTMALIDTERATALYDAMGPGVEASGGAAANTTAGVASLGGAAGFIGKVRDDQLGEVFAHDIRAGGVAFEVPPAREGLPTGRCLILVTPDAERTMNTYLGAAAEIGPGEVDPAFVARGAICYVEGFLWDAPLAKQAVVAAMEAARAASRRVAFSLSDPFCVERHRDEFRTLIDERIDIVFANEEEACALLELDDLEAVIGQIKDQHRVWAITRGAAGSVVVAGEVRHDVPATPVEAVVDTTGAGDLYAAGFLWGLTHGQPLEECARLGAVAAAEVISHFGARPVTPLATLR